MTIFAVYWHKKNLPFPEDFFIPSALLLLMLGIFADNHHAALALDDLAFFADGFHGRSYFHGAPPKLVPWISPLSAT